MALFPPPAPPNDRVFLVVVVVVVVGDDVLVLTEGVGVHGRPSASAVSYSAAKNKINIYYLHSCLYALLCHGIIQHNDYGISHS